MPGGASGELTEGLLGELLKTAPVNPLLALARLFRCLSDDHASREAAVHSSVSEPSVHDVRVKRFCEQMERKKRLTSVVARTDALALLEAIDSFAQRERSGSPLHSVQHVKHADVEALVYARPKSYALQLERRQPNRIQYWLRHHWVLPLAHQGIQLRARHYRSLLALTMELEEVLEQGEFRIHLGGFDDGVEPDWTTQKPSYGCTELVDKETRWKSVERLFQRAASEHCRCVVLPELTLTPELRERVAEWLVRNQHPFLIVVPGSFHEVCGGKRRNVAVAFDRNGHELLRHEKLRPMRVLGAGAEDGVVEDIEGANALEFVGTPLGLLALAICLDFCDEVSPFENLWHEVGPGVVLVPSMSDAKTARAHEKRAASLCRAHGALSAVAIQPAELPAAGDHCWGLVYTAASTPRARWVRAAKPPPGSEQAPGTEEADAEQSCSETFLVDASKPASDPG